MDDNCILYSSFNKILNNSAMELERGKVLSISGWFSLNHVPSPDKHHDEF